MCFFADELSCQWVMLAVMWFSWCPCNAFLRRRMVFSVVMFPQIVVSVVMLAVMRFTWGPCNVFLRRWIVLSVVMLAVMRFSRGPCNVFLRRRIVLSAVMLVVLWFSWGLCDELPGQGFCCGNAIQLSSMQSMRCVSSPTNCLVSSYVGGNAIQLNLFLAEKLPGQWLCCGNAILLRFMQCISSPTNWLVSEWLCYFGGNAINLRPMQSVSSPTNCLVSCYVAVMRFSWGPCSIFRRQWTVLSVVVFSVVMLVVIAICFVADELPGQWLCCGNAIQLRSMQWVSSLTNCLVSGLVGGNAIQLNLFLAKELPGHWLCWGNTILLRSMQSVSSPTICLVCGYLMLSYVMLVLMGFSWGSYNLFLRRRIAFSVVNVGCSTTPSVSSPTNNTSWSHY
jgi:hypothetical protein